MSSYNSFYNTEFEHILKGGKKSLGFSSKYKHLTKDYWIFEILILMLSLITACCKEELNPIQSNSKGVVMNALPKVKVLISKEKDLDVWYFETIQKPRLFFL